MKHFDPNHPVIISVTGTKGKTTVTRAIAHVLHEAKEHVLRVDTDGHYINEKRQSTLDDAKALFSLVPTVCPGKYLITMKQYMPHFAAVLETALGSSGAPGIGYGLHQIGIFTNIFEDHIGASSRLRNRADLAKAKRFIFERVDVGGSVIFNADDRYVCSQLRYIPEFRHANLIPVGTSFAYFDLQKHLKNGGTAVTNDGTHVIIKHGTHAQKTVDLKKIPWTFDAQFQPSIFNIMCITAGVFCYYGKSTLDPALIALIENYRLEQTGGRLTLFQNKQNVRILLDYAHEKFSLRDVAKLAKKMRTSQKNRVIGVVRLAPDRPDQVIHDTGSYIANNFDDLIVYDKIDGVTKKRYVGRKSNIVREAGEVSSLLFAGVKATKKSGLAERIIIEEEAMHRAAALAQPGDLVVVICGDDHDRTISYIKKYFSAQFC